MSCRNLLMLTLVVVFAALVVGEPLRAQASNSPIAKPLEEVSESFRAGSQGIWIFVTFFIFLIALAAGLIYFDIYVRQRNKADLDNPRFLFIELVRAHELNRTEKQFLTDFADESNLEDPLPLFIEPEYFLTALDDERFRESYRTIAYLLKKLFGIEHADFRTLSARQEQTYSGATTIYRPFDGGRGQGTGMRTK